jgi:co-chaperonin GroES (HSP10)
MTKLKTLHTNLLFRFEDELVTSRGIKQFKQTTEWGFQLGASMDSNTKSPRWGIVVAVGEKIDSDIKPGMRVLVEALKWTEGVSYGSETVWLTNQDYVLAVDDEFVAAA